MSNEMTVCIYGKDTDGKFTVSQESKVGLNWMSFENIKLMNAREFILETEAWDRNLDRYMPLKFASKDYQWARYRNQMWRYSAGRNLSNGCWDVFQVDGLDPIEDHFAHIIYEDGDRQIEFFTSVEAGEYDKLTKMKIGRYLTRYYPHLTTEDVKNHVSAIDKASGFKIAITADEIEKVYLNGPNSCMSHSVSDYETGGIHPVRVYGDSDLQLAYLSSLPLDHNDFHASSRALIWPAQKIFGRIYGNESRMRAALEAEGYSSGFFSDALLPVVWHPDANEGRCIMPYLDGIGSLKWNEGKTHFVISNEGPIYGGTEGVTQKLHYECYLTGRHELDEPFTQTYDTGRLYCIEAAGDLIYRCYGSGNWYETSHTPQVLDGDNNVWSKPYASRYLVKCPGSGLLTNRHAMVYDADGRMISRSWAEANLKMDIFGTYRPRTAA